MSTTEAKEMKSVSGLRQGDIKFIDAARLERDNVTGVVAEGTYEGSQEKQTKFGPKRVYNIRAANGDLLAVSAAGNLNFRMEQAAEQGLEVGDAIQIVYNGKSKASTGQYAGTMMHSFDVLIESED